jgi:localization factor PodJL
MKSGGPWNLRGLRPETREAARDAARRSGMSVGEWLNSVIQQDADDDYGEPMRPADYDDDYEDDWRSRPRRRGRDREATMAREEIGEVNARLDRLTHQIERIARGGTTRLTGAPAAPQRGRAPPLPRSRPGHQPPASGPMSVDDAVAEIAERQRTLYGDNVPIAPPPQEAKTPPAAPTYSPSVQAPPSEPSVDISNLDDQLRYITRQIESLRPSGELRCHAAMCNRSNTKSMHWPTGSIIRAITAPTEMRSPALRAGSMRCAALCRV